MRYLAILSTLAGAALIVHAQGGSGSPSPVGQSVSPRAASAADRAVELRHEQALARSQAGADKRAAKRAAKAASKSE